MSMKQSRDGQHLARPLSLQRPGMPTAGVPDVQGQDMPAIDPQGRALLGQLTSQHMQQGVIPTGQTINVNMNTPSPHLSFKEWMARGVVGGIGKVLAFPFKLVGTGMEAAVTGIVSIIKIAVIVVMIPTLIWLGLKLQASLSTSQSIEEGAAKVVVSGRRMVDGAGQGMDADINKIREQERQQAAEAR